MVKTENVAINVKLSESEGKGVFKSLKSGNTIGKHGKQQVIVSRLDQNQRCAGGETTDK